MARPARCVLVLAESHDDLAVSVIAALQRGGVSTRAITPLELSLGCQWAHRIERGVPRSELRFSDTTLDDTTIGAVLNRLAASRFFPGERWARPGDAAYAEAEFGALAASWLASLHGVVLGRPRNGLLVDDRGVIEWLAAAAGVGLPVRTMRVSSDARHVDDRGSTMYDPVFSGELTSVIDRRIAGRSPVIVADRMQDVRHAFIVGERVVGAPHPRLVPALQRLARGAGCNLLECQFGRPAHDSTEWVFCGASTFPVDASRSVVEAVASVLAEAAGRTS